MSRHSPSFFSLRRGVVIQPFVVLFAVLLVGMLTWRVLSIANYANSLGPMVRVNWERAIWTHVGIGAAILAIAGGIGALAYFTASRSERAAAMAMAVVLGAGAAWFGYLNIWGVFKSNNPSLAGRPATLRSPGPVPPPSPDPRTTPAPRTTPSMPPQPFAAPSTPVSPAVRPPSSPPSPDPSRRAPTAAPAAKPEIAATVAAFNSELDGAAEAIAKRFDALVNKLKGTPERSRSAQDAIVKEIDALVAEGNELASKLESSRTDLEARLKSAGVDTADAGFAASKWHGEFRPFSRQMGLDAMGRLFEPAREQAVLLRDTIGKWNIKGGEPDFGKDRETQRKADWARQRLSGQFNLAASTSRQIRGR